MAKTYIILITLCIISLIWISPINIAAATKDLTISLEKDYNICQFNITLPDTRPYKVTILGKQNEQLAEGTNTEGESTLSVTVNNCKAGNYKVHVETIDSEDLVEIGTISVSVSASRDTAERISSTIKVARDIVDLKTYFKDNNIVIEWKDETVGNINIDIINTKTHEVIYSVTERDNKYVEYPLDNSISQITVSIVPAESAGIADAGKQITLNIPQKPDASVSFNNIEYTNEDSIPCYLTLNDIYGVQTYVNNNLSSSDNQLDPGKHTKEIMLQDGENIITVYLIDHENNMFSTTKTVIHDTIAPTLMIQNNYDGAETYNNFIELNGTVQESSFLFINNTEVKINADGTFTHTYPLHEGENLISIVAIDDAGNESTYEAIVTRLLEKKQTGINMNQIAKFIPYGILIIAVTVIFIQKKKASMNRMKKRSHKRKNINTAKKNSSTTSDRRCLRPTNQRNVNKPAPTSSKKIPRSNIQSKSVVARTVTNTKTIKKNKQ